MEIGDRKDLRFKFDQDQIVTAKTWRLGRSIFKTRSYCVLFLVSSDQTGSIFVLQWYKKRTGICKPGIRVVGDQDPGESQTGARITEVTAGSDRNVEGGHNVMTDPWTDVSKTHPGIIKS